MYTIDELKERADSCNACGLGSTRENAVLDDGYSGQKIMLVGEAPGETEDVSGRPFTGLAGALLDEIFEEVGIDRSKIYITNILKCRPINNATPTEAQTNLCTPILEQQILTINPDLIIAIGAPAMRFLLKGNYTNGKFPGITKINGLSYTTPGGRKVIPVIHPAYVLRNGLALDDFKEALRKVKAEYDVIYPVDNSQQYLSA
jgi:uracil-DNA glycosylase family 4